MMQSCASGGEARFMSAILTWAAHSSAAVVVFVMSLGYAQFITPTAGLRFVLDANLGRIRVGDADVGAKADD
jgi:Na+/phosphate symporter